MNESNSTVLRRYYDKQSLFAPFIEVLPSSRLKIIVVIPCFNEPNIISTLSSLAACDPIDYNIEVITVVNTPETADYELIKYNQETHDALLNWANINNSDWLQFHNILVENIPKKHAGAGYARKAGMDEAIHRFLLAGNENGIICSLDADTLVTRNYFTEIEKLFNNQRITGCSIYFEHPIEGNEFPQEVYRRIIEYETHLRYYKWALQFINFPFYHYTIGSCFAVNVLEYCNKGGMNKKQAGEDFYFIQKIMHPENYTALNTTTVFPSSRPSDRVPFGTGPVIKQYSAEPDREFLTYHYHAFLILKVLFNNVELFYKINSIDLEKMIHQYHPALTAFLKESDFTKAIQIINEDTSQLNSFIKRFYQWFDAFRIVKYLNFVHDGFFHKQKIREAVLELIINQLDAEFKLAEPDEILLYLRALEKNKNH